MKSISIVFEKKNLIKVEFWIRNQLSFRKHYFQRFVVKDSKSSTCSSFYDFEFALNELNVKDSTTNDKWCERLVKTRFFFFCDDSLLFIRRFQIISSSFVDVQCDLFFSSTFRRRYRFNALFVSEELDLEKKFVHETKIFIERKTHCWISKA
jgi:hypothetical protein